MNFIRKIRNYEKIKKDNLTQSIKLTFNSQKSLLKWSSTDETKNNFGDALNPWLFEKITGEIPVNANKILNVSNQIVYSCIGSILDNNKTKNVVVWGSGFKKKNGTFIRPPKKITAVRGPYSRENIIKQGIECPEVYGDPALLLPKYYNPQVKKEYKLGIIPHYVDKNNDNYNDFISRLSNDILIIDIESNIENVIDSILKCEKVASSSLHGIIVADAYNIPSLFVKFSDNIVGEDFKFKDYMASVNRDYKSPIEINGSVSLNLLLDSFSEYSIKIDLDKLLEACPFYKT